MNNRKTFSRESLDAFFQIAEGFIYLVIGILLLLTSGILLYDAAVLVMRYAEIKTVTEWIVPVIDTILLTLMVIEILYTVRVSFKSHSLIAEPFLIIALIAAIRRILVISVESAHLPGEAGSKFMHLMIEMGILGGLIVIFVGSILFLRRKEGG